MKVKDPALVQLGKNIKSLREQLSLSQEDLAFEAALDRTYIGGVERGERSNPTVLSSLKIAKALKVELSDLVKEVSCA